MRKLEIVQTNATGMGRGLHQDMWGIAEGSKLVQAREMQQVSEYLQGCYINSDLLFIMNTWEGQESTEVICSKEV